MLGSGSTVLSKITALKIRMWEPMELSQDQIFRYQYWLYSNPCLHTKVVDFSAISNELFFLKVKCLPKSDLMFWLWCSIPILLFILFSAKANLDYQQAKVQDVYSIQIIWILGMNLCQKATILNNYFRMPLPHM